MEHSLDNFKFRLFRNLQSFEDSRHKHRSEDNIISLRDLDNFIETGGFSAHSWIPKIEEIRQTDNKDKKKKLESELPAILVSEDVFTTLSLEIATIHTGLICLAIDKKLNPKSLSGKDQFKQMVMNIRKDEHTFRLFLNTEGNGMLVFVKVPSEKKMHDENYKAIVEYYLSTHGLIVNEKLSAIDQLWPLSYDPDLYKNESSKIFERASGKTQNPTQFEDLFKDKTIIESCVKILCEVNPPIIDSKRSFIGKKGPICVWIDTLKEEGIIEVKINDVALTMMLKAYFKDFTICSSMFRKGGHLTAKARYKKKFQEYLSQFSQRGKVKAM